MPPRLPRRPPLGMKLWLAQYFGRVPGSKNSAPQLSAKAMSSFESIEHAVRNRVRMFLRHTWLVAILGSLLIAGGVGWAVYINTAPTDMRVAAGPPGSIAEKFVEALTHRTTKDRDKIRLSLVSTEGPQQTLQALAAGKADLAVLPSTAGDSSRWPVVAILRQNVLALIVPAPPPPPPPPAPAAAQAPAAAPPAATTPAPAAAPTPPPATAAKEPAQPAAKDTGGGKKEKAAKQGKESKSAKAGKNGKKDKNAKAASGDKKNDSAKNDGAKNDGAKTAKADTADKDDDSGSADDSAAGKEPGRAAAATAKSDSPPAEPVDTLDKVTKLAGKRVAIVTGNAATADLLNVVLKHYGVPLDKVRISSIDPKDMAEAVKASTVDAFFVAGSSTGAAVSQAVAAATRDGQAPSFIAIDQADGIAARVPALASVDVDAGTFGGNPPSPDDSLKSLTFADYFVAKRSLDTDGIAALAKLIYSSRLELAAALPGEIKIESPSTEKDAAVAVHPGALIYLGDDQKSFFDKYGDAIFYGLLIFPVFGSAIAAVAGYFRSGGRTKRLRLLQRIIDLVRTAHGATTIEALDRMQAEIDHLVVDIIHHGEREEYDQTSQASFLLALDQARFAVAARRMALLDGSVPEPKSEAAKADGEKTDAEKAAAA